MFACEGVIGERDLLSGGVRVRTGDRIDRRGCVWPQMR